MTAPYVIVMWPSLGTETSQAIEPFYLPGLVFTRDERVWRSWSSAPASGTLGDARDTVEDLLRDADTAMHVHREECPQAAGGCSGGLAFGAAAPLLRGGGRAPSDGGEIGRHRVI